LIQNTPDSGSSQSWFETPQTYGPPPAPADLAVSAGNGEATLSWGASERATSYTIMRGAASGEETTTVASNVTETTYTDSGLTNGAPYYYLVVAANSTGGASPNSNEAAATPAPPVPSPPTGLFAGAGNGQAARLPSWPIT
jgi:cellulose 1,4-beta-cellobiosidase